MELPGCFQRLLSCDWLLSGLRRMCHWQSIHEILVKFGLPSFFRNRKSGIIYHAMEVVGMADRPCLLVQLLRAPCWATTLLLNSQLLSLEASPPYSPHISPHLSYSYVQVHIFYIGIEYRNFEFCCFRLEVLSDYFVSPWSSV